MAKLFEADDYILSNVILLFLIIAFNLEIGVIYIAMAVIDWFSYYIYIKDTNSNTIPIERNKSNRIVGLFWATGAYVAFMFVSAILISRLSPQTSSVSGFEYIASLVAQTFSATPILYGSKYVKYFVWGVLIPIIETRFFFRTLFIWVTRKTTYKMPSQILSFLAISFALFFGALFAVFHIVAKGITNNNALLVTGIFGFASLLMIIYFKEYLQAVYFHIINNSVATQYSLNIGVATGDYVMGIVLLAISIGVSYIILFFEIPFIGAARG
jgi:hypothetical protein